MPAVRECLTPNFYLNQVFSHSVNESSLLRLDPYEHLHLDEQDSIILNSNFTSLTTIIGLPTKSDVDSLNEINRNRRDLSSVYNDQNNEIDENNITSLDSITVNRDHSSDNELANKKYFYDSIGPGNVLLFIQTLENYLKVSVGNDVYNLTKND